MLKVKASLNVDISVEEADLKVGDSILVDAEELIACDEITGIHFDIKKEEYSINI